MLLTPNASCSSACPQNCSGHGVCGELGRCLCDPGYSGMTCSLPPPPPPPFPSPPPPAPPPAEPGFVYAGEKVTFVAAVEGALQDLDMAAYKLGLSLFTAVPIDSITLHLSGGSVIVSAVIEAQEGVGAAAAAALRNATRQQLEAALGVTLVPGEGTIVGFAPWMAPQPNAPPASPPESLNSSNTSNASDGSTPPGSPPPTSPSLSPAASPSVPPPMSPPPSPVPPVGSTPPSDPVASTSSPSTPPPSPPPSPSPDQMITSQACQTLIDSGQQERPLWVFLGVAIGGAALAAAYATLQWYGRYRREQRASLLVQPGGAPGPARGLPGEVKLAAATDASAI
eukprot:2621962-Prymnesium_polylepis.1